MFRRAAVPSSALRALRALIAPASTAAQNQQPQNLQNGCCTNLLPDGYGLLGREMIAEAMPGFSTYIGHLRNEVCHGYFLSKNHGRDLFAESEQQGLENGFGYYERLRLFV